MADADGPGAVLSLEEVQALGSVEEATTVVMSDSRIIVTVEEAAELVAVDRIVGGVEVEHDPVGRSAVGLEEEGHEEAFDIVGAAGDLLVPAVGVGSGGGQFEAVERALAGQRLAPVAVP